MQGMQTAQLLNKANSYSLICQANKAGLFSESMSMIEPKIIYRNLHVPIRILDPVSLEDIFPFENQNHSRQQQHPPLVTHRMYENTGHNIHCESQHCFWKILKHFFKTPKEALGKIKPCTSTLRKYSI